jgi:uncharacterized lipoprotein YmbA
MMRMLRLLPLLAALVGCATSPTPNLYTLQAVSGAAVATQPVSVELRRIGLAGYLDRPELVKGSREYRLLIDDSSRWAERLGPMLDRVLTENLVQRLPKAAVFAESGAISTRADVVLEIDIQRLDAELDGTLVLLAQLALRPQGGVARASTIRLTQAVAGSGAAAQAAAMSAALGGLADRIAGLVAGG